MNDLVSYRISVLELVQALLEERSIMMIWITSLAACPAGTYRSQSDPAHSCIPCPHNTNISLIPVAVCPCIPGFFRTAQEDQSFSCTRKLDYEVALQHSHIHIHIVTHTQSLTDKSTYEMYEKSILNPEKDRPRCYAKVTLLAIWICSAIWLLF